MMFICKFQELRCVKYNGPYKSEHYWCFTWYCKVNFKINLPRLETKQGELYSHLFKYLNCKRDYQADSNIYPFWKYQFNKEWHIKKYQEFCESRKNLIHSAMSGSKAWLLKVSEYIHKIFKRTSYSLKH